MLCPGLTSLAGLPVEAFAELNAVLLLSDKKNRTMTLTLFTSRLQRAYRVPLALATCHPDR